MAPEGALGSRRERISGVEVLHCRSLEILESFNALSDYRPTLSTPNVRGRRLALGTTALRSPPMHRRAVLRRISSLSTKVKRFATDRSYRQLPSVDLEESTEGKCRFYTNKDPHQKRSIIELMMRVYVTSMSIRNTTADLQSLVLLL